MGTAFVSGAYTATFNGQAVGQIEDGFELETTFYSEPIRGDNLGDSIQDGVYRGGDCFIQFILCEFQLVLAGLPEIFNIPAADGAEADWGKVQVNGGTQVGYLMSALAKVLVLTGVAGTPATVLKAPSVFTANKAILAPNYPVRTLMAPRFKRLPIRLQLLPYTSGDPATEVWFVPTVA